MVSSGRTSLYESLDSIPGESVLIFLPEIAKYKKNLLCGQQGS